MTRKQDWYVLHINPEPWKIGPINYNKVGQDPSLKAYQEAVQEALRQENPRKISGPIKLSMWFWHERVRYDGPNKEVVKNRVDVTNMQKATEDALQGILFHNDRDVVEVRSCKVADEEGVQGGVVICVEEADEPGTHDIPSTVMNVFWSEQTSLQLDNEW